MEKPIFSYQIPLPIGPQVFVPFTSLLNEAEDAGMSHRLRQCRQPQDSCLQGLGHFKLL